MKRTLLLPHLATLTLAGLTGTVLLVAESRTYDFKDPKGVNNVAFTLDAPLEAINGSANGIRGKIEFDRDRPEATRGRIVVEAASMHVPNPMMKEHMHGPQWMDVAKYPEIVFTVESLKNVRRNGPNIEADAVGRMQIHGVEKPMTIPVRLTWLPDKLAARTNGRMQGDLLVVRAQFTVKRSDFGINPSAPTEKVADEVQLKLAIAGAAPR